MNSIDNSIDHGIIDSLLNTPGIPLGVLASILEKKLGCSKLSVTEAVRRLVRQGVLSEYGMRCYVRPLPIED
jgi:DNA-binding Lrp family transcriptional regulator